MAPKRRFRTLPATELRDETRESRRALRKTKQPPNLNPKQSISCQYLSRACLGKCSVFHTPKKSGVVESSVRVSRTTTDANASSAFQMLMTCSVRLEGPAQTAFFLLGDFLIFIPSMSW
jgi:hypothetical protein